jgi:hypothetical protein
MTMHKEHKYDITLRISLDDKQDVNKNLELLEEAYNKTIPTTDIVGFFGVEDPNDITNIDRHNFKVNMEIVSVDKFETGQDVAEIKSTLVVHTTM